MKCPVCRTPLVVVERESVELDWCPACAGVWFDEGELVLFAERLGKRHRRDMIGEAVTGSREARRRCPRCRHKMEKVAPAADGKLLLDCCVEHGLWFDAGELGDLMRSLPDREGEKPAVIEFLNETFHSSKETPA